MNMNSMFNLPFGSSKNKPFSRQSSSKSSGSSLVRQQNGTNGTATQPAASKAVVGGGWFRSTSSAVAGASMGGNHPPHHHPHRSKTASCDGSDFDFDGEGGDDHAYEDDEPFDPLMYRLQHQKEFLKERQQQKREQQSEQQRRQRQRRNSSRRGSANSQRSTGSHRRSVSEQHVAIERDPFDLWGSLTSEEESIRKSNHSSGQSEEHSESHVDVAGWETNSNTTPSRRRPARRRSSQLSDHSEEDEDENDDMDSGLVVDFGGVTPLQMKNERRRRRRSTDPEPFSPALSRGSSQHYERMRMKSEDNVCQNLDYDFPPRRHTTIATSSNRNNFDAYLGFPGEDNDDEGEQNHIDSTSSYLGFPERRRSRGEESEHHMDSASSAAHSHCPSHADLANILSDLEKESETLLSSDDPPFSALTKTYDGQTRQQTHPLKKMSSAISCSSSLSSPTEKYRESMTEKYRESMRQKVVSPSPPENVTTPFIPSMIESPSPSPQLFHADELYDNNQSRQRAPLTRPSPRQLSPRQSPNPSLTSEQNSRAGGLQRGISSSSNDSRIHQQPQPQQHKQQEQGQQQEQQQKRKPPPRRRRRATVTGPPSYQPIKSQQSPILTSAQQQNRRSPDPIIDQQKRPSQQEEEECPRLTQLRQQTTEELQSELRNMQSQSKMNLEKSWAETEKMRVELCELDDKVNDINKKLEEAKEKLLSSGLSLEQIKNLGRPASSGGNQFISRLIPLSEKTNTGSPSPNKAKGFRRRRTIDAFSDNTSSMIPDALSLASLRRSMIRTTSLEDLEKIAQDADDDSLIDSDRLKSMNSKIAQASFRNNNNYSSPNARNALRRNDREDSDLRASEQSSNRSAGKRGFLGDLGASIRMKMGGGASVCSMDYDLGFDMDDADDDINVDDDDGSRNEGPPIRDDSSRKPEFNDKIYKSLLAGEPMSVPTPMPGDSDDDSSDAISGVFYPPPQGDSSQDGNKSFCKEVDFSSDDSSDAKSGVFYLPETRKDPNSRAHSFVSNLSTDPDEESSDAKSGVFYPPEETEADDNDDDKSHCTMSLAGLEMDDFDFDPFKTLDKSENLSAPVKQPTQDRDSKRPKPERRRGGFARRPSFMSLFDGKIDDDDDSDSSDDEAGKIPSTSYHTAPAVSLHLRQLRKEQDEKDTRSKIVEEIILKKEEEIQQLAETVQMQEEEIRTCEMDISHVNSKCFTKQKGIDEKEGALRRDVEELTEKDEETEAHLDHVESSEQKAREMEQFLQEKLALIKENSPEQESEPDLESQLDSLRERHDTRQEDSIGLLSALLTDIDTLRIPSLRDEELLTDSDHSNGSKSGCAVSREIVRKFDALTDKEEELVNILSDPTRLKLCQKSFQQNQKSIEKAMHCSNQLAGLESDLRSHLNAVKQLIKQDGDEGTHTTESSTASERLSLERMFVETIISYVVDVKQNQGKRILDALSRNVEFLTCWDQLLLPEGVDTPSTPTTSNCSGGDFTCSSFDDLVSLLDDVAQKAKNELSEVKSRILSEHAKFQARMHSAGLSQHQASLRTLSNDNGDSLGLTTHSHGSEERERTRHDDKDLNKQLSRQLSAAHHMLSERESLGRKYSSESLAHPQDRRPKTESNLQTIIEEILGGEPGNEKELEELDSQISTAMGILSERESLKNKYSADLRVMQAQAREESSANLQLASEIQLKIKHLLEKLAEEEALIASLERSVRMKKEEVGQLESQLLTDSR